MRRVQVLLAALLVLAAAPSADAATVTATNGGLEYDAAAGEANNLTVVPIAGGYRVRDEGAVIARHARDEGCTISVDAHGADCAIPGGRDIAAFLGDGNDKASATALGAPTDSAADRRVSLYGADGDDELSANGWYNSIDAGEGADVLAASGDSGWLRGGSGNDRLTVTTATSTLEGGDGDDTVIGDSTHPVIPNSNFYMSNDVVDGGPGSDTIEGGAGRDGIRGGAGDDVIDGGSDDDQVDGDGTAPGGQPEPSGRDRVSGGAGNDGVSGGPGDDHVDGAAGRDVLQPGYGADTINGGDGGDDTLTYADRTAPVTASVGGASSGEAGENDKIAIDVEGVIGGSGPDWLLGNDGANVLTGGPGNDVVDGAGGRGDFLTGGDGDDLVISYDGNRALDGPAPSGTVGFFGNKDDAVLCNSGLGNGPGGRDVAVMDPVDMPGWLPGEETLNCDTVLFGASTVAIDTARPALTVPVPCLAGLRTCQGKVAVRTISGQAKRPRLRAAPKWRPLGRRAFARKGKRGRKVTVKLSRRALRSAGRRGRVRAFVTYEYRRPRARRR